MLSSVFKLQKFIKLEVERGYDNRAVVGGLDKILPSWENEARDNRLDENVIQTVVNGLRTYPTLDPPGRADVLSQLLNKLTHKGPPLKEAASDSPVENTADRIAVQSPILDSPPDEGLSIENVVEGNQIDSPPSAFASAQPQEPAHEQSIPLGDSSPSETSTGQLSGSQASYAKAAQKGSTRSNVQPSPAPRSGQNRRQQPQAQEEYSEDTNGLRASVKVLPGVGNQYASILSGIGLETIEDLLYYFPRRYDDYSQLKPINRLVFGEETTVLGTIQNIFTRPIRSGKMQITEAVVGDGTGFIRVSWFNQPWLTNKFTPGTQVVLAGKIEQYLGRLTMNTPEIEQVEQEHLHTNRIVPVYPLTARLTQRMLRRIIYQAVNYWAPRLPDYLPENIRAAVKLPGLNLALQNIHYPESQDMLDVARWRLAFDEIFLLQLGVQRMKRTWKSVTAQVFETPQGWLEEQTARLPFTLTQAQQRAISEVCDDLASGHPMDRLIQGDVGSGKTAVAALAVALIVQGSAQSAIMAPTGILAEQHYRSLTNLLAQPDENGRSPLQPEEIRLLTGDTHESEREEIRAGLANGSVKLLVGTHALYEDPATFQRLQLIIIDEQHRFGVAQRAALRSKGENPHLLVMTATPIPRSLALTVYGDLDVTVIDELPPGRKPVETYVLPPVERERAYTLIESQVKEGYQAFIIYPLVEQGENGDTLAAVEEQQRLQNEVFRKQRIGLLHGRLKPEEKDEVMRRFRDKEYDILVSTSVVEVGVDIPNATVMLIEGANRFGLAQLHQIRGRVGRGGARSFCLLIPDHEDALENERLKVMSETNDGFILAERDLQQRGPGEFLGTRQAGFSELTMANLTDVRLIEKAREQAQALFQNDPDLAAPDHKMLAKKLDRFWGGGRGDIS